jgi:hypothetical protein
MTPGPVSESSRGPGPDTPYVPSWCYDGGKPPMCSCGHHHGYHGDDGVCNQRHRCGCRKYDGADPDAQSPLGGEQEPAA